MSETSSVYLLTPTIPMSETSLVIRVFSFYFSQIVHCYLYHTVGSNTVGVHIIFAARLVFLPKRNEL